MHMRRILTAPPVLAAVVAIVALYAVSAGSVAVPASDTLAIVTAKLMGHEPSVDPAVTDIIWELRVPRVLLAMTAGAGLALAGVVMQASVQNPLAEPFILGIASGASVGATLAILLGSGTIPFGVPGAAFLGAILATLAASTWRRMRRGCSPRHFGRWDRSPMRNGAVSFCPPSL